MTAADVATPSACKHCGAEFANRYRVSAHIRDAHPEHRKKPNSRLITPVRGPRPGGSLKSPADTYPGRP
jgi:hypothetical protein